MPRGAKKGERRGGRGRGTPNKSTVERALFAERVMAEQQGKPGKKLGREVVEDFMHLFAGMAAVHQPLPPGVTIAPPGHEPDREKFDKYAAMAVDAGYKLAEFQSPKISRVTMVTDPSLRVGIAGVVHGAGVAPAAAEEDRIFSAMEAYELFRDTDIIDLSPEAQLVNGKKIYSLKGR